MNDFGLPFLETHCIVTPEEPVSMRLAGEEIVHAFG
jgi:hypothetical protein